MGTLLIIAMVGGLGILALRHINRIQADRDRTATAQTWEHIDCPMMITSNYPGDPTVRQRAEHARQTLQAAGNRYWSELVIEYPFTVGADPKLGYLAKWSTYRYNCLQKEQMAILEWNAKQQAENPALFNGHILGQQSPN